VRTGTYFVTKGAAVVQLLFDCSTFAQAKIVPILKKSDKEEWLFGKNKVVGPFQYDFRAGLSPYNNYGPNGYV